jgi:hypothetical protein
MKPRQSFYSTVFEQINNYKKRPGGSHSLFEDKMVLMGIFASALVLVVFGGYFTPIGKSLFQQGPELASRTIKVEKVPAADLFTADNTSASQEDTVGEDPGAVIVRPTDDSYVSNDNSQKSYGSDPILKVSRSPERVAYLKFYIPANQPVSKALFRIYAKDKNDVGGALSVSTDNLWSERLLTFDSRPIGAATTVTNLSNVTPDSPVTVDITQYVKAGQSLTIRIDAMSTDNINYASKESASDTSPAILLYK